MKTRTHMPVHHLTHFGIERKISLKRWSGSLAL
jgi:hypothetical protein